MAITSDASSTSAPQAALRKLCRCDGGSSVASWNRLWMRCQRVLSISRFLCRSLGSLAEPVTQPCFGRAPVAQNRGFRNPQQLGNLRRLKSAKETAFDDRGLARLKVGQF